jgi:hypothetical protein
MSAKKLRADPDDQPPIEERSIMMPDFARIRPVNSQNVLKKKAADELYLFYAPCCCLPHACSINIIRDFFSNAKCNFPANIHF